MKFLMCYQNRLWALGFLAWAFWMAGGENFEVFATMCLVWVVLEQANHRDIQENSERDIQDKFKQLLKKNMGSGR